MEKLKLFSREQVGNAPLTGRQYSRPDSLSLVSRQSVLAFLLVLLTTVFGVGNAWGEETVTWAISGVNTSASGGTNVNTTLKTSSITPNSETGVWTAVASNSYAGSNNGAQLGSGSYKFAGTVTLSGTAIPATATITGVTLKCTTGSTSYKVNATVAGQAFGSQVTLTGGSTATDYPFAGSQVLGESGTIVLTFSLSSGNKNVVIKSLSVTYTAVTPSEPHTVSFNVGGSTGSQADITEASAGAGITLPAGPTPTCFADGWTFAGWAEAAVASQTTTAPSLLAAGTNFKPSDDVTLYAVYKRTESGAVTDQDVTETFENQEAGSTYNSTMDYAASASNANIAWTMYYGCVSSNVKLTGDKSAQMRWYKSATSNLGYIQSTTPISGLQSVSFNAKTDNANSSTVKISVWYSTDGDTWTKVKDNEAAPTTTTEISATIAGTVGTDYYVRIGVGDAGTAPLSSSAKLTIDDVHFSYKAGSSTTYYLSSPTCCTQHAVNIAAGIEHGSVSADPASACEGATITLTFTPALNYHLSAWTLNGDDQDIAENTFTMPDAAVTVSATFAEDACTPLGTPSVAVSGKAYPYDAVKLAWTAIEHADAYKVYIYDNEDNELEHNDAFAGVEYTIGQTLSASTTYKYSVQAISNTPATYCPSVAAAGTFETDALPTAHLTLIALGEDHASSGDYAILTPFNLPATAATCSKAFVGWDANSDCATAPTYAKGAEFQFNDENDVILYAVYADETPGAATLTKLNGSSMPVAGDKIVIVGIDTNDDSKHALYQETSGSSYVKHWAFDNNVATVAADAKKYVTLEAANDGKFYLGDATNGYVYSSGSNNLSVDLTNKTAWTIAWDADASAFTFNQGRYLSCRSDLTGDNTYLYRLAGGTPAGIWKLDVYKYGTSASTFSNYATTCSNLLDNPTFSLDPVIAPVNDKYEEAINVVITNNAGEGTIYYTTNGENPTSASDEYTDPITLNTCGTKTIKAIVISATNHSEVVTATYEMAIPIPSVSAEDPYTEAEAVEVYNSGCYNNEDVYVTGTVKTAQFFKSNTYTITLTDGFQFYYFYEGANEQTFTSDYIKAGDVLVACGKLDKHNSTYQLGQGCYLVSRTEAQKTPIESSLEEPITVAAAIDYIDKAAIYDLSEDEYVKGVITAIGQTSGETPYIDVKDADQDNTFRFFNYTINNDITETPAVYDVVIAVGKLDKFYNTYELNGCEVVALTKNATPVSSVTVTETATVKAGKTVQLTATVLPANAANKNVTWSVNSGTDYASVDENGVVTGIAAGEAVIEVKTVDGNFTATCTVTVTEGDHVYAYYNYEKVTATADITDGEYLIVYEGDATHAAVAFNGSLETLDAAGNGITVEIEEGKIEGTDALHAATFTIDATAGTLQSASGKYIGVSSNSNGLSVSEDAETYTHNFSIDEDKNAVIAAAFVGSTMTLRYNYASDQLRFRYFKNSGQQAIALYKKVGTDDAPKAKPELAFDPETVTLKLGEDFTAPMLGYAEGFNGLAAITYASSDEDVAVVGETTGEVTIKAVGEAIITATFAGNANYKAGTASYTIKVNAADAPDPVYYIKVTSAPADWSGEYLLVYEDGANAYVWNGDYTDGANNYASATISENKIAIPTGAAVITIAAASEDKYTLLVNGEKYFQDNGSNAKLIFTDAIADAAEVTISYETDWVKILFSERCIRFNSDNGQKRFRYYADSSQKAVQLYKKEGSYTTVRKELAPNAYYTMCLEQEVTAVRGASIWKVVSKADNSENPGIILEEVTGKLDAGRPYIFYATADKLEVVYSGTAVNDPVDDDENNGLIGSFTQKKIAQSDDHYIIYNNALYYVNTGNVYVGAHRAYLDMTGVPPYSNVPQQGNAPRRRVTMAVHGPQVATGMENVQGDNVQCTKVMINGQLYIMYNGTMYNVQGQLVR